MVLKKYVSLCQIDNTNRHTSMKRFIVTIAMALMLLTTGATDDYWFRTLDVKTGLSDNYVKDILRDRYGFMWMATSNGLNRYDGYQFKVYTVTQLGSNNDDIVHLAEDGDGTLWIQALHHLYTTAQATE